MTAHSGAFACQEAHDEIHYTTLSYDAFFTSDVTPLVLLNTVETSNVHSVDIRGSIRGFGWQPQVLLAILRVVPHAEGPNSVCCHMLCLHKVNHASALVNPALHVCAEAARQ